MIKQNAAQLAIGCPKVKNATQFKRENQIYNKTINIRHDQTTTNLGALYNSMKYEQSLVARGL